MIVCYQQLNRASIQVELEFENAVFLRGKKTGVEKPSEWGENKQTKSSNIFFMARGWNQV